MRRARAFTFMSCHRLIPPIVLGSLAFMMCTELRVAAAPIAPHDDVSAVRQQANRAFEQLDRAVTSSPHLQAVKDPAGSTRQTGTYSPDHYVIGTGQGDLTKGRLTCQRVAELSARSELAKQIRVLIKEHAIDRTRERSGHATEQDLEVTREEIVQEYLQGVKIVERHVDETAGLCTSTAVMPRQALTTHPVPESPASTPASSH